MSTICKLDPNVRLDRTIRRQTLRQLHRTVVVLQREGNVKKALQLGMIAAFLEQVRQLSSMPGWLKEILFNKHLPRGVHG